MALCEKLKDNYLSDITTLINEWKEDSIRLAEEGSEDEAVFQSIKVNIGEIFYKMFTISYTKTHGKFEDEKEALEKLGETYYHYFERIPTSWREKMNKDKEYNRMEEYYKEKLKLETAEKIRKRFTTNYDRFYEEV